MSYFFVSVGSNRFWKAEVFELQWVDLGIAAVFVLMPCEVIQRHLSYLINWHGFALFSLSIVRSINILVETLCEIKLRLMFILLNADWLSA